MREYKYVAYGEDKKIRRGTEKASSEQVLTARLTGRGYRILSIKAVPPFMPSSDLFKRFNRIPNNNIILLSRQLALLLENGTPMVSALEMLKKQVTHKRLQNVLGDLIDDLRRGQLLSQAMGRHPDVFSKMYIQSVLVGERSGSLETVLVELADHMEREAQDVQNVKNALRYPSMVVVVAIIVVAILAIFVFPTFSDLYEGQGWELPWYSKAVFYSLNWLGKWGIYIVIALVVAVLGFYIYSQTPDGKINVDRRMLKLPGIGRVIHLSELSRCCRSMALLHRTGLPISETITLIREGARSITIEQALDQVHQEVIRGQGISGAMSRNEVFLPMMVQMISVGEATGTLDETLIATARTYETEAANRMQALTEMIQPVVTVVLAAGVGLIAAAMVGAMYSMYSQVGI